MVMFALVFCLPPGVPPSVALGDALVVTRAMTASTIAQIYVEEQEVRVEIEMQTQS
jgi:hypothetical protein